MSEIMVLTKQIALVLFFAVFVLQWAWTASDRSLENHARLPLEED